MLAQALADLLVHRGAAVVVGGGPLELRTDPVPVEPVQAALRDARDGAAPTGSRARS